MRFGSALFIIVGSLCLLVSLQPVSLFGIILGIIIFGIGVLIAKVSGIRIEGNQQINDPDRKGEAFENWIAENLIEYDVSIDNLEYLYTGEKYYIYKPEIKKFIFIQYSGKYLDKIKQVEDSFDHAVIDLNNVKKISLKTNDQIIGEITKENAIGRALVGGALFGAVGAIVGGASAKEKQIQTNEVISIELEIVSTDVKDPYSTLLLYHANDKYNTDFEQMEHTINNLYWSLQNCFTTETLNIEKKHKSEKNTDKVDTVKLKKNDENVNGSLTDNNNESDLLLLGKLYKDGLITKEEFQIEKEKLLSKS